MSEKRLFWRDPSTGVETPLLVYDVDTTAVSRLQINKQDVSSNALTTTDKTIVGAINELKTDATHTMHEPYVAGTDGQVLTSDGAGGYAWETHSGGITDASLHYNASEQSLTFVVTR